MKKIQKQRKGKSKKWKHKKLMSLIKSKSFESTQSSDEEKNYVLYLGDRAEPGKSGGASLNNNNRSSGKLSIRRRRKNRNRSSSDVE